MTGFVDTPLQSIAIAGAWGYIGQKFLAAARKLGLRTYLLDPGEPPGGAPPPHATRIDDEDEFYDLDVDLFHLALHPQHREKGLAALLERARRESVLILNEKPMAPPEDPEECGRLIRSVAPTRATMLFDFPELFDGMTHCIVEFLAGFDRVEITDIAIQRSKDREDPDNPRNYKSMVSIQYQETVHCLAFVLDLLGRRHEGLETLFGDGVAVDARADPYLPPNPEAYSYVVDGRCRFTLEIGPTTVTGCTDFKSNAPFKKVRVIKGRGDGREFTIEVDYLEDRKYLRIDGVDQGCDPGASSYEQVITTLGAWRAREDRDRLMHGLYPNPEFAHLTYRLSGLVWRSCYEKQTLCVGSLQDLLAFDPGFAAAARDLPRYGSGR